MTSLDIAFHCTSSSHKHRFKMSVSTVYDDVVASVFEDVEHPEEEVNRCDATSIGCEADDIGDSDSCLRSDCLDQATAIDSAMSDADGSKQKRQRVKNMSREEKLLAVRRQIEYYFSDGNLAVDSFFHEKISENPQGWIDAALVLGCNRIKKLEISDETDIDAALDESELETQWLPAKERGRSLQLRRKNGRALPDLRVPGWLRTQIAQQRLAGTAKGKSEAENMTQAPKVGDRVRLTAGESAGQSGRILSVDGHDFTVLIGGVDVAVVSPSDLEVQAAA